MRLLVASPRSPALRGRSFLHYTTEPKASYPKLAVGFLRSAGRSQGKRSVFSKGSLKNRPVFRGAIKTAQPAHVLGCIVSLLPCGRRSKAVALVRNAFGSWYYSPCGASLVPLSYQRTAPISATLVSNFKTPHYWFWRMWQCPPHTRVSWLSFSPDLPASCALAAGSTALLIATGLWAGWSFVILPSGAAKLIPDSVWVVRGPLAPAFKSQIKSRKAGYGVNLGRAPQVRGTVMNPNDHPHGGRTRAIKYPRTPWGRSAKKSRKPAPNSDLKPLLKRRRRQKPLQLAATGVVEEGDITADILEEPLQDEEIWVDLA